MAAYSTDPEEIMAEVRSKFQELTIKAAGPAILSIVAAGAGAGTYVLNTDANQDVRIAKIEETRFTREDGLKMEGRLKEYMNTNYFQSAWLKEKLDKIEKSVESIDQRLHDLENRGD